MKKTLSCIGLVLVLSIFALAQEAFAFEQREHGSWTSSKPQLYSSREGARSGSRGDREHSEIRFHQPVHYERHLPVGYRTMRIANTLFYYLNGIFYQNTPYGYQVVTAPVGTIVRELPYGCYQVWYGGTAYYVYNNTYYTREPWGFRVVMPPPAQAVLFPVRTGW